MTLLDLAGKSVNRPSIVTIGVFDGVHSGHQHLIRQLVTEAHAAKRSAIVLTFFPHPDIVLRGVQGRYYLTTPQQRAQLMLQIGVDHVVTFPFNQTTRQTRAADLVDELVNKLQMQALWVGSDFAMGYKREGDVDFLREQGGQKGFEVQAVELLSNSGTVINSTKIRDALLEGRVDQANEWLGRPYELIGEVVHGEKRGRQLGYPTANLAVWEQQVIPAYGIYAGWATVGGERFMAMTNVGIRPTFDGDNVTVEAYLLNFDRDIYGQEISLTFDKFLRPEARFDSLEALIDQIGKDVEEGRVYLLKQGQK